MGKISKAFTLENTITRVTSIVDACEHGKHLDATLDLRDIRNLLTAAKEAQDRRVEMYAHPDEAAPVTEQDDTSDRFTIHEHTHWIVSGPGAPQIGLSEFLNQLGLPKKHKVVAITKTEVSMPRDNASSMVDRYYGNLYTIVVDRRNK